MSKKEIQLNVGGHVFLTTKQTCSKCRKLFDLVKDSDGQIFLDRDPIIFKRMLKFLRGYPIPDIEDDDELIHELIYWEHYFNDTKLCKCISSCYKKWHQVADKVHFGNPEQVKKLKKNCCLVPKDVAEWLWDSEELPNENKPLCYVVCTKNWKDHLWIKNKDMKNKFIQIKLRSVLFNKQFCICNTSAISNSINNNNHYYQKHV